MLAFWWEEMVEHEIFVLFVVWMRYPIQDITGRWVILGLIY